MLMIYPLCASSFVAALDESTCEQHRKRFIALLEAHERSADASSNQVAQRYLRDTRKQIRDRDERTRVIRTQSCRDGMSHLPVLKLSVGS